MKLCLAGWNAEILDRVFRVQYVLLENTETRERLL